MNEPRVATDQEIKQLLKLANVPSSDKRAMSWLETALNAARASDRAVKRPLPADHNDRLADVANKARALAKQLQRLGRYPHSWHAFWRSFKALPARPFHRRAVGDDEVKHALREAAHRSPVEADEILSTLKNLECAARAAKDPRKGRPRVVKKQQVVDLAFAFFVRCSPLTPSGTPTGPFARFARAFYAAAIGSDSDVNLDRQLRAAIKRLPVEQERAKHMS